MSGKEKALLRGSFDGLVGRLAFLQSRQDSSVLIVYDYDGPDGCFSGQRTAKSVRRVLHGSASTSCDSSMRGYTLQGYFTLLQLHRETEFVVGIIHGGQQVCLSSEVRLWVSENVRVKAVF